MYEPEGPKSINDIHFGPFGRDFALAAV
jgi:hypothetical protein